MTERMSPNPARLTSFEFCQMLNRCSTEMSLNGNRNGTEEEQKWNRRRTETEQTKNKWLSHKEQISNARRTSILCRPW